MGPIQKLVLTNLALGVSDITKNQASTLSAWDTIDAVTTPGFIEFYSGSNTRTLPETNLTRNRLDVQTSLVVQKIILANYADVEEFQTTIQLMGGRSLVNLYIGNSNVIKDMPLMMWSEDEKYLANPNGDNGNTLSFIPLTSIVIPPQIEFRLTIQVENPAWVEELEEFPITCNIQGIGAQFSNRNF